MAHVAGEWQAQVDQRVHFDTWSPMGLLRIDEGLLSWQPKGWGGPVWSIPGPRVVGGDVSHLVSPFDLWVETDVTGALGLRLTRNRWGRLAEGPDYREQENLDGFVAALREIGGRIHGEPRSYSFRAGIGGLGLPGLPDLPGMGGFL